MSIRVMTQVWANSRHKGSALILLLAIADHADDEGYAHPGVESLAKKCRMSERNTRYVIDTLVASGELKMRQNTGRHGTNEYWVAVSTNLNLFDEKGAKIAPPGKDCPPGNPASKRVQPSVKKGATAIAPESSVNVKEPSGERATRLSPEWQLPKPWGEWALVEQPTWTADHVRRVAEKFKDHWTSQPGRAGLKLKWDGTWRNWVRNEGAMKGGKNGAAAQPWFRSASGITEKGRARGFDVPADARGWEAFKAKVYAAEGVTREMLRAAEVDFA